MHMIEWDEDDIPNGALDDYALHLVTLFCGVECHDKLLYEGKREFEVEWYGGILYLDAKEA